jgi:hypothetical protein
MCRLGRALRSGDEDEGRGEEGGGGATTKEVVLYVYNSLGKPGRRGDLEDRPHIIESGVVQDTTQRLTRIELRPRFDDLSIFIKSDALLLHLARQDEGLGGWSGCP